MAYYTATGNPGTQTSGRSGTIREEFILIQEGFGQASNDIQALAAAIGIGATTTENDIASAATCDIGNGLGNVLRITGTNNIASFGANYTGAKQLRFAGVLVLTQSSTLLLPGGANITTAANDVCIAVPIGNPANGWRVLAYCRMGKALVDDDAVRKSDAGAQVVAGTLQATGFIGNLVGNVSGTATNVTGTVGIANGGTGATTEAGARATLGVAPQATRIDVASVAGTVDLAASAPNTDDIRITGALAITAFTVAVGRVIRVIAGGAFSLANNASIVTNTGATLTLRSGDSFVLRATAANVVEVLYLSRRELVLAQRQRTVTFAVVAGTGSNIPVDNTIPQITEGDEFMTLSVTPTLVGSTLKISAFASFGISAAGSYATIALFRDAVANALSVATTYQATALGAPATPVTVYYEMVTASLTAITFRIRAGSQAGATLYLNGTNTGIPAFGQTVFSHLLVEEYLP